MQKRSKKKQQCQMGEEGWPKPDPFPRTPLDERTIFHVASLNKSFTAASMGIPVEAKKLSLNTPVHDILPDFISVNKTINDKAKILDLLSHRTRLAAKNMLWLHELAKFKSRI